MAGLYDEKARHQSIAYGREKYRVGLISSALSIALLILAITQGWFALLDERIRSFVDQPILISLLFIASLSLISWLIDLPFALYGIFSIEERYGFNKITPKTFVLDSIKGSALTILIGGPVLTLILWLYERFDQNFWIYSWSFVAIFSLVMFMFGTSVLLPLFNKLTPLEDGELKSSILAYCASQGYTLNRLFVMDGSKRSTKANAFFSGLGKSKMIVLFDTLIEKLTTEEITAVLAHEVGHYKRKHTLQMFIASNAQTFAIFALLGISLQSDRLPEALGISTPSFHVGALAFFLLLAPLNLLLGLLNNSLSRRNEFDADQFARLTYEVAPMKSALKKISTASLSNLTPHPLYVAIHYTHPPLAERLKALSER